MRTTTNWKDHEHQSIFRKSIFMYKKAKDFHVFLGNWS